MNILHINHVHYIRGGAEVAYFRTAELLESYGHNSVFFSMRHPKNIPCDTSEFFMPYVDTNARYGILEQLKIAGRILYSFEAKKHLSNLLDKYKVDIAHLHNIYHTISPSILHVLKNRKIPAVMTVNDPKLVCASHNWQVNDMPCNVCKGGRHYMAVIKRCIKNSFAKSVLGAVEMYLHHKVLDIYENIDIFIYPSLYFKNKFEEMGFKKKGVHLPYPLDIKKMKEIEAVNINKRLNSVLFVGNLLRDKGIMTLLDAARLLCLQNKKIEIRIVGDGPLREEIKKKIKSEKINNITLMGHMQHEDVFKELKSNLAVVLPAECPENLPFAILEAFALGVPVIGSRLGGITELAKDNERGLTFEPMNPGDLAEKIKFVIENPDKVERWGINARKYAEQELSYERHYPKLMEIYKRAMQKSNNRFV